MDETSFYTPEHSLTKEKSHPNHWYNRAADLRAAAGAVWHAMGEDDHRIAQALGMQPGYSMNMACVPVYHMLCGLSLEVIIKAVMACRGMTPPEIHDLNNLAGRIDFKRSTKEKSLLKYYTHAVVWAGRYPIPRNCSDDALRGFYGVATDALTKPTKKLGALTLRVGNEAANWDNFHALWRRIAMNFEFK